MKVVLIANYLPDTNYTRDLSQGYIQIMKKNDKLFLCGRKNEPVTDGKSPQVDLVWKRGTFFFLPILAYILKHKPDVVHFQQEFKTYGGTISAAFLPLFMLLLRLLGFKVVVTFHSVVSIKQVDKNFMESFGQKDSLLNKLLVKLFFIYSYKCMMMFVNYATVHAPMLKQRLLEEYTHSKDKVVVIEHGIRELKDLISLPKNPLVYKKYPVLKNKNIIIVFGYFSPRKGYEFIIKPFLKLSKKSGFKNWVMVLAGDVNPEFSDYKRKIENLIKKLDLKKKVIITGFVGAQELDEFYRISKVAVIPAAFSFNSSGALSIALAYKKLLLVSNVKPISEEIANNNIGLLYENFDSDSFEQQLHKILAVKSVQNKIQRSVNATVNRRYWRVIAKEHYDLYRKALR